MKILTSKNHNEVLFRGKLPTVSQPFPPIIHSIHLIIKRHDQFFVRLANPYLFGERCPEAPSLREGPFQRVKWGEGSANIHPYAYHSRVGDDGFSFNDYQTISGHINIDFRRTSRVRPRLPPCF